MSDRLDLAHALALLLRVALTAEEPVLRAHDLRMWDYAVLGTLEAGPAPTQAELAEAVGRDKTRLIPILDRLEGRGLLRRVVDPGDRRNRVVELTPAGRERVAACRREIQAGERDVLRGLDPAEAAALTATLDRVARPLRRTIGAETISSGSSAPHDTPGAERRVPPS
jgi:DNA-binding MarR family transcriptional regulator